MKGALLIAFLLLCGSFAFGQSNKPSQSNSLQPFPSQKVNSPRISKKKKSRKPVDAREEFYDRMDALAKTRRKNEKKMDSPQYTDFQYFGHKKPPKKRPPEKMKYCKICGIRH